MNITIHSAASMLVCLNEDIHQNVVSIRDATPNKFQHNIVEHMHHLLHEKQKGCDNLIVENFDDIWDVELAKTHGLVAPARDNIERILEFCRDKHSVAVHCNAGICRSSATAFIIGCTRMDWESVFDQIIDVKVHFPNELVLKLGAEILGDDTIVDSFWEKFNRLAPPPTRGTFVD